MFETKYVKPTNFEIPTDCGNLEGINEFQNSLISKFVKGINEF